MLIKVIVIVLKKPLICTNSASIRYKQDKCSKLPQEQDEKPENNQK